VRRVEQKSLSNPILPGFYPDPSICRVGNDFYMITSSFSLFPGIPIFHSTDLMHWEQIGHVLDRESQLHVTADHMVAGIMAPTIRFHNGVYYVIGTNFSDQGNFIVTATDPRGPWSEPYWLLDAQGIDPSLFFDEDGKAYFTGTRREMKEDGSIGDQVIWLSEIDLQQMKLIGQQRTIWGGALRNCASPEAPHLYKKDDYYYLIIAEGGTEHFHAVTVARSQTLFAPFQGYVGNPIMTHRHLGKHYPICNVGHADLVELPNGEWYAVMLASRLIEGYHKNLGRETYIAPVTWEEGWPIISAGTGKIEWSYPAPNLPVTQMEKSHRRDHFESETLAMDWVFIGTPYQKFYTLASSELTIQLLPRVMNPPLKKINVKNVKVDRTVPTLSFIGRRQLDKSYRSAAKLSFHALSENETAGLIVMQACNHNFRLERSLKEGRQVLRLIQCTSEINGYPHQPHFQSETTELELASEIVVSDELVLAIEARGQDYSFFYGIDENNLKPLYEHADGGLMNPEVIGGMVGTMIGMYGSSNGQQSENFVIFDWFDYEKIDD